MPPRFERFTQLILVSSLLLYSSAPCSDLQRGCSDYNLFSIYENRLCVLWATGTKSSMQLPSSYAGLKWLRFNVSKHNSQLIFFSAETFTFSFLITYSIFRLVVSVICSLLPLLSPCEIYNARDQFSVLQKTINVCTVLAFMRSWHDIHKLNA